MKPRTPVNYLLDSLVAYAVGSTQRCLSGSAFREHADFIRYCFGKLGASVALAVRYAAFLGHVPTVILFGSSPKMFGICARRVVAAMQDAPAFRKFAAMNQPRQYMGTQSTSPADGDSSVTELIHTAQPLPAGIGFTNLLPEACVRSWGCDLNRVVRKVKLVLHSKFGLLCHALGCFRSAEALLLLGSFNPTSTINAEV